MNHKVNSVQTLYDDANSLYNNLVVGGNDTSADTIINNLYEGINTLKNSWEGKDAGVQIQNLVVVHNAMVGIRNVLAKLASDSSSVASNYREIQNANGAGLEMLGKIYADTKTIMGDYSDVRDTVSITPDANVGKQRVDAANNGIDGFVSEVTRYYNAIMDNWTVGTGRDNAREAFELFLAKAGQYKQTLSEVSGSITTALQNYTF